MKNTIPFKYLRYGIPAASFLAFLLRKLLYATAVDEKGLLIAGHWATWTILILSGLVLGALALLTRNPEAPDAYQEIFCPSALRGGTSILAAITILIRAFQSYEGPGNRLEVIAFALGVAAGLGLLVAGICRLTGTKPNFLCHCLVSIFFAVQMLSQYRHWSTSPQLMDYGFYLTAFIFLMMTAYYLACFDGGIGNHRALQIVSMAAGYFCCLAIPEAGDSLLLITCALWAFCCLPQLQPRLRRQRASMNLDEEP